MGMSTPDKYSAVWVSHTSLADFTRCPRAYYLKNVYKDPKTGHKLQVVSPALSLGLAVHEVVESLSLIPTTSRFDESLLAKFERVWPKNTGKKGGFTSLATEELYKQRGIAMLQRAATNPGPLKRLSIKIKSELPQFWLSESENIILCGKIDWLEYLPDSDSVSILDFKTSKSEEDPNSLQLPIYYLLASRCQKRPVVGASYWYLDFADAPIEKPLPNPVQSLDTILSLAKQVKLARQLNRFRCPNGDLGCNTCKPLERVIKGEGEFVGTSDQGKDLYLLTDSAIDADDSVIL